MTNPEIERGEPGAAGPVAPAPEAVSREERWRRFFLGRLEYLIQLRDGLRGPLSPERERLVKRALYSTYRDCLSLGVGDEARARLGIDA
jgi:hypothetical protein